MASDLIPLELDPNRDPWDRQPKETERQYAQFCCFKDFGRTRTIRRAAESLAVSPPYLRSVAGPRKWKSRCEAWDLHTDELHLAQWLDVRRKAADNDAKLLDGFTGKVAVRLQALRPEEMEVSDLIRALDVVMRHRRHLFGDPQLMVAVTTPGGDPLTAQYADLASMTYQARQAAIAEMVESVQRRAEAAAGAVDDDDE